MAWSQSSKVERFKWLLYLMFKAFKPRCWFCGKPLDPVMFYPKLSGKQYDDVMFHHKDGSGNNKRPNESPSNLKICHRGCHRSFHRLFRLGTVAWKRAGHESQQRRAA